MRAIATNQNGRRRIAVWISTLWIAAALLAAATARADIYFWEDGEGVIHFSNQDAPPKASLYMREFATPDPPEPTEIKPETDRDAMAGEVDRRQALTQQRLEEASGKLKEALERVDVLTESVARSRVQAAEAADAARQAELDAEAASSYRSDIKERVIVHTAPYRAYDPYRHRYKDRKFKYRNHKFKNRHSRYLNHEKKIRPRHHRGKSKIDRLKRHRRGEYDPGIPGPILPPERTRIPKAYGIR